MDDTAAAYVARRGAASSFVPLRRLRYHLYQWGDPGLAGADRPPLVLLHGWMDVGASFQFFVDALAALEGAARWIVAPDWRGFGLTDAPGNDSYVFADYLGDLDALVDHIASACGAGQVDLLGHSMGGNVAMAYAGARPERLRRLVNLEGFGMPATRPAQAPLRMRQWLDELKTPQQLRSYTSLAAVAGRLMQTNPRLPADKAAWLAPRWSRQRNDGRWHVLADPAHKRVNAVLYRQDEATEFWKRITAPALWVEGDDTRLPSAWGPAFSRADFDARMACIPHLERTVLIGCGHMLHHDQPEALAARVRQFLDAH